MKITLAVVFLIALAAWAVFGYIIWSVPPKIEGQLVLSNFLYALGSSFVGLSFALTLFLYLLLSIFWPKKRAAISERPTKKIFWASARRAGLLSTLLTGLITLNVFDLLNILNGVLLVGILVLIEIYFSSR